MSNKVLDIYVIKEQHTGGKGKKGKKNTWKAEKTEQEAKPSATTETTEVAQEVDVRKEMRECGVRTQRDNANFSSGEGTGNAEAVFAGGTTQRSANPGY